MPTEWTMLPEKKLIARIKQAKRYRELVMSGKCTICAHADAESGYKVCERCRKMQNERKRLTRLG
jgi:uncharacterized protein YqfB (UPF0267 family)